MGLSPSSRFCFTESFSVAGGAQGHSSDIPLNLRTREGRVMAFRLLVRRALRPVLGLLAAVVLGAAPAPAQELAALPSNEPALTEETREEQFDALARDVELLEREGNVLKRLVRLVKPTVVHIEARRDDEPQTANRKPVDEAGSGVVIESGGRFYILTNRHVIKHSQLTSIRIRLADGRVLHPTQAWTDRETDVAVLAVSATDLIAARLGDSSNLDIGDFVLAVGSPFGLSHSVTYGIISAKGRRDLQLGDDGVLYQDFLQTDAAINPGNSGGPLLNLRGEVVGINTAIASSSGGSEGIGFAIPINMAMIVGRQLIQNGVVVRAYLGVHLDSSFSPEDAASVGLSRPHGARVTGVNPQSPAEAADIRIGDVILQFDSVRIEDDDHLVNLVSLTPVEKQVDVVLLREGKVVQLQTQVGNRADLKPLQTTSSKK
jgi:serine protease Do